MRLRLAAVLFTVGILGLSLSGTAEDRRGERRGERTSERGDEREDGRKKPVAKPADPEPADPKPAEVRADKVPSFKKDVAPLLKDACAGCHSGLKQKAKLDVTNYDSLMKFVKAGDPDKSKLHNSLLGNGAKLMPPKNPLSDDQIAMIRAWIAGGAKKD